MQLVLDGPKNKTITFITVRKSQESNKRLESLALLEQAATLEATKERKIPSVKFEIKKLDGPTLGSIFLVFQLTVILLARNLNINPFNQPAVELIKKRLES
jgi:glucose-6-phosphate isomerase